MVGVSAAAWAAVVVLGVSGPAAPGAAPPDSKPVPTALAKGQYPWYDAQNDQVQPVWPSVSEPDTSTSAPASGRGSGWFGFGSLGELVGYGLALLALTVLLVVLIELWRRYRPEAPEVLAQARGHGTASRIEGLPVGVRSVTNDPWNEALRLRAAGDYAGAVVCLFAHQLLTLERLRQVRLIPGRTGRQLVRAVDDPRFRRCVEPTLRLFEGVYYGHHAPTAAAFERVWARAEDFERLVAVGAHS